MAVGDPYSPKQLAAITRQLAEAYGEAERRLLKLLSAQDITAWKTAFATQQLAQVRAVIEGLNGATRQWAEFHIPTLYSRGMYVADNRLYPGGLSRWVSPGQYRQLEVGMTSMHRDAMRLMAENVALRLGEANQRVGQRVQDMVARARMTGMRAQVGIRDATLQTMQRAFAEGATREQASRTFLGALRERGITSFVDKAGREWDMRTYAEMVARTGSQEAQSQAILNRTAESGNDLVRVTSHGGACPLCEPWEGEILSISGESDEHPSLAEAEEAGLFHPNCAHAIGPHVERTEAVRQFEEGLREELRSKGLVE